MSLRGGVRYIFLFLLYPTVIRGFLYISHLYMYIYWPIGLQGIQVAISLTIPTGPGDTCLLATLTDSLTALLVRRKARRRLSNRQYLLRYRKQYG